MKYFNKKLVVLVFIVLIIVSILPKSAFAVITTTVIDVDPKITSAATWASKIQQALEWVYKLAVEVLKRQLLNMIVDQIVVWIQGGGEPKFITNWPGFFRDAVDQAGGKFLQQIGLSQLCSPFRPLLRAAFIPIPTFSDRTSCTLSQIGVNIDEFLKDFKKGNWIAWQEMVLRPQNNVYGAYVMAWDQYEIEKSAAAKVAAAEAQAGRGFLNVKRCLETDAEAFTNCVHSEVSVEECTKMTCTKWETVTPGAVVGDLAAKAVGSDIDYIVNAQDFKAYVAAITNAILNRMFAEGVGLLHTAVSGGGGGGGGGSSAQTQCAPLLGTAAYNDCITAIQTGIDIREFEKKYMISLIDRDLTYQNQLLGAKQATLTVLNQSAGILMQLQNCQASMSIDFAQTQIILTQVQSVASTIANQITQIQSDIIALQIKQQEIRAVTDLSQIPPLWAQVANVVNPSATQSLALAAQQETSQKQQEMSSYEQQLSLCQAVAAAAAAAAGGQ